MSIRFGGLMVTSLVSGSSGPGSSQGWGQCVVFMGKPLYSYNALSTQVYKWVPANLMLGVTLRWISIPYTQGKVEILRATETVISCSIVLLQNMVRLHDNTNYTNQPTYHNLTAMRSITIRNIDFSPGNWEINKRTHCN